MKDIFTIRNFEFPYDYHFPGQASDERILFVTRENKVMLWFKRSIVLSVAILILFLGWWLSVAISGSGFEDLGTFFIIILFSSVLAGVFAVVGLWWTNILWKKSLGIVTTKRLTKFVYTTPFNRHSLSLPLEMIVDTGAYTKGFLQAILKLGTFTARSSAASSGQATDAPMRINKKYFYIENQAAAEDLQHYINKLLNVFRNQSEYLASFRPFIPNLKGENRKKFMEKYPEYWS